MRVAVVVAVAFIVLLSAACKPSADPGADGSEGRVAVTVNALGTTVATVVITVDASDIDPPLVSNLTLQNGIATGTIHIPAGTDRVISALAFESDGAIAYEGSVTLAVVERGANPPVSIPMLPRSGQVPITVQIGAVSVVVAPATTTLAVGRTLQLEATILAASGDAIDDAPQWATTDPTVLAVTQAGLVTALREGQADIVATYAGVAGVSRISTPWVGVKQLGTAGPEWPGGLVLDEQGNVYVSGTTEGAFAGHENAGGSDAFVAKLGPRGDVMWVKQYGTAAPDDASSIALDASGFVYVAGSTGGSFGSNVSTGFADALVMKLDANGSTVWAKQFGTTDSDVARAVVVDAQGRVYVSGMTSGAFPGRANAGPYDAFVAELDAFGDVSWVEQFGSAGSDWVTGLAIGAAGEFYASGFTDGSFEGYANAGWDDAFVAKILAGAGVSWVKQLGTAQGDFVHGLAADTQGNAYVAGSTAGAFEGFLNAGWFDAFVAKLDAGGNVSWLTQFGTAGTADGDEARAISVDALGEAYVAGGTSGAFDGYVNAGGWDAYMAKLDAAGGVAWVRQFGTMRNDHSRALAIDDEFNVFVLGQTDGVFAANANAGTLDVFVAKLDPAALPHARATLSGSGTIQVGESARTLTFTGVGVDEFGSVFGTFTFTAAPFDPTFTTMNCVVDQLVPSADPSQSWCVRGACDVSGYWATVSVRDSHDPNVADAFCGLFADADTTNCYRSPAAYSLDFIPLVSGDFTTEFVP